MVRFRSSSSILFLLFFFTVNAVPTMHQHGIHGWSVGYVRFGSVVRSHGLFEVRSILDMWIEGYVGSVDSLMSSS